MKYNKSEIMKTAWELFRKYEASTLSSSLKRAWAIAKEKNFEESCKELKIVEAVVRHCKVIITISKDGANISGSTFNCKQELKKFGCRWNGKAWTCNYDEGIALIRRYAA